MGDTSPSSAHAHRHRLARLCARIALAASMMHWCGPAAAESILFIGNSMTYGMGSPVRHFGAGTVTDLNHGSVGGVPALFKAFTIEAGLDYDVFLETNASVGLAWHLNNRRAAIGKSPWDIAVLQGFSTVDPGKPGDPVLLVRSAQRIAAFLQRKNPSIDIRLVATWPRADLVYRKKGTWHGKSLEAMAADVRAANDKAAASTPAIKGVIPVGEAWMRVIQSGFADANPYDGIDAGKVDLWGADKHHASTLGYYLEALVIFGAITGRDPRLLGANECAGFELGLSPPQVATLQRIAFDQLGPAPERGKADAAAVPDAPRAPVPCARSR